MVLAWFGYGTGNGLAYPPGGISGKLISALVFKFLHRPHQPDVAFLDQSRKDIPRLVYFLAMLTTSLRLASTSFFLARLNSRKRPRIALLCSFISSGDIPPRVLRISAFLWASSGRRVFRRCFLSYSSLRLISYPPQNSINLFSRIFGNGNNETAGRYQSHVILRFREYFRRWAIRPKRLSADSFFIFISSLMMSSRLASFSSKR